MLTEAEVNAHRAGVFALQARIGALVVAKAHSIGINQSALSRMALARGVNLKQYSINKLYQGKYERQLSLFSLSVLCECVGLSLLDVIQVKEISQLNK